MLNRRIARSSLAGILGAVMALAQPAARQENPVDRINRMSDGERLALAKSALDQGMPTGDLGTAVYGLAQAHTPLILPLIERKIEECLSAPAILDCFTDKTVNAERSIFWMADAITRAGNQEALLEAGKLIKLDEKRFDFMVKKTLSAAADHNPFTLAYQGFDLGDPAIDKRIVAWADDWLSQELPHVGNPVYDGVTIDLRHQWAEAMVERYGGVPTPAQWTLDPIVSRVKPATSGLLYRDVHRFAAEVVAKRGHK